MVVGKYEVEPLQGFRVILEKLDCRNVLQVVLL